MDGFRKFLNEQSGFLGTLTIQPGIQFAMGTFLVLLIAQIFGITIFALAIHKGNRK